MWGGPGSGIYTEYSSSRQAAWARRKRKKADWIGKGRKIEEEGGVLWRRRRCHFGRWGVCAPRVADADVEDSIWTLRTGYSGSAFSGRISVGLRGPACIFFFASTFFCGVSTNRLGTARSMTTAGASWPQLVRDAVKNLPEGKTPQHGDGRGGASPPARGALASYNAAAAADRKSVV